MNEKLTINFNFLRAGVPVEIAPCAVNTMIEPMYCTEIEIVQEFLEEESFAYMDLIRKNIFDGSLQIDAFLSLYNIKTSLTPEQLFLIKRDFTICHTIYNIGNQLYLDYMQSVSKEKFLGDVKISLEYQNDPTVIKGKFEDAKRCEEAITAMFKDWHQAKNIMQIFVKGFDNNSSKSSSREWWWNQAYQPLVRLPMAATKIVNPKTNTLQKIASVNISYYDSYYRN